MTTPDFRPISLPSLRQSAGLKLILICALVLLMGIPAMFIGAISYERSSAARQVTEDVSRRYGGEQMLIGPILSVPYETRLVDGTIQTGQYILYPDRGQVDFKSVNVETKTQSLYKVPVYTASGRFHSTFENEQAEDQSRPAVPAVYGQNADGTRVITKAGIAARQHLGLVRLGQWLSVPATSYLEKDENLSVSAELNLSGAQSLSVAPFAKSTEVVIASNWPDPGFQGEFTPTDRTITKDGFTANWTMPYLSRGIRSQGRSNIVMGNLAQNMVRVKFVNTDNPYQTVNRALKYSILFIGLVFLAYFLFEIIVGTPVHPAQYILIGLAQAIFYLLLLAFAERVGFVPAFFISAVLTVSITSAYAGTVFGGRSYIWKAGSVFSIVYGLLFVLMRIEDFALLIGALASFVAIAATMYLTRDLDWYGGSAPKDGRGGQLDTHA